MSWSTSASQSVSAAQLSQVALFYALPEEALQILAASFEEVEIPHNGLVFEEGDRADSFFLVRKGALAAFRDAVGEPVQLLARLHGEDFFGELGLFGDGRYKASVRATEPSLLWRIDGRIFHAFITDYPSVQLQLQAAATRRYTHHVASALELGRRREVRIRCKEVVAIDLVEGPSYRLRMENLSLGGICLSGAPPEWTPGSELDFGLEIREGALPLAGAVCWRSEDTVGIAFHKRSPRHDMLVQMAIRLILESKG